MHFHRLSRKLSNLAHSNISPASINSSIKSLVQQGQYIQALKLYSRTSHSPTNTTKFTFPSLIKACASLYDLNHGKPIHSSIITLGLQFDLFIATSLINMYVRCGSFHNAVQVFDELSVSEEVAAHDVTVWNSMLDGYFRFGLIKDGIARFCRMQTMGIKPDAYSICMLLGVCDNGSLGYKEGKQIHGYIIRNMLYGDSFVQVGIIDMYLSCNRLIDAWFSFCSMEDKHNVVAWNVMIGGFCENGYWDYSLELYSLSKKENVKPVSGSLTRALTACWHGGRVGFGRQVHCDVVKTGFEYDSYVCTSLLTMYAKCKLVEEARNIFDQIPIKEIESWNALIAGYSGNGYIHDALLIYNKMRCSEIRPDSFTLSNILSCCSMVGLSLYDYGKSVHAELVKRPLQSDITVQSALLTMYSKCGSNNDEASSVFHTMKERDVVAWGSMISGCTQNRKFEEALASFKEMKVEEMVKPDSDIMASVVSVCTGMTNVCFGCQIHGYVIKTGLELDMFVGSSLIDMYSKFGFVEMAGNVFSNMQSKNLVAWNSMISCCSRNGLPDLSIRLFHQMVKNGLRPDSVSVTSVLVSISSTAALLKGKTLHGYLLRQQIPSDIQVQTALLDMYIKSGLLKYAQTIFLDMPDKKNLIAWNSMISGYGSHGQCHRAMELFDEMKSFEVKPDDVTFLSLISGCNHSGFVEEGKNLFYSMRDEYGIEPRMEHYVNIVDLMGRAGRLEEAYSFVETMPIEADRSVWLCLLSSCRAHRNVGFGELVMSNLLKLEPSKSSNCEVQLMNIYGDAGLWDKAAELRGLMKEKGLKKSPGCSWIEVRNGVEVFFSGDSSSQKTVEIFDTLHCLKKSMKKKKEKDEVLEEHHL